MYLNPCRSSSCMQDLVAKVSDTMVGKRGEPFATVIWNSTPTFQARELFKDMQREERIAIEIRIGVLYADKPWIEKDRLLIPARAYGLRTIMTTDEENDSDYGIIHARPSVEGEMKLSYEGQGTYFAAGKQAVTDLIQYIGMLDGKYIIVLDNLGYNGFTARERSRAFAAESLT
jgi:hypothetical protein